MVMSSLKANLDHEMTTPGRLRAGAPEHRQGPIGLPAIAVKAVVPDLVGSTVEEIERELILQTLAHCRGNRTHAARVLDISVRTLRNKIRDYVARGLIVTEPSRP
jgi:DNA-binding NtrC family response regulator